jgi:hypothetical protein
MGSVSKMKLAVWMVEVYALYMVVLVLNGGAG